MDRRLLPAEVPPDTSNKWEANAVALKTSLFSHEGQYIFLIKKQEIVKMMF